MSTASLFRPVLVLAANTPWVYALARSLADYTAVTAVRLHDLSNYVRLKPQWPETESAVHRVSCVMPPGYAGNLEPLFRPFMRGLIAYQRLRLRKMTGSDPLVLVPYPYMAGWVRGVPRDRLVYYNLDEYPFYDPSRRDRILKQEGELVARARLTLCLSVHQVLTLRSRNAPHACRIRHFPLGVVEDFLNPEPHRQPVPRSIGYVGNLSDRVDWEFVLAVARLMPEAEFHFVGEVHPEANSRGWHAARTQAFAMPNVHYEGQTPQAEVRNHYWRYAVNWMPYDTQHGFNIASCPTKIMDALASGRPFVSTDIPEVQLYPDRIACVKTPAEASRVLSCLLGEQSPVNASLQIEFARAHTWHNRANDFQRFIRES